MTNDQSGFADAALVASYAQQAPTTVPGYHAIHTMASVLLAERAPDDARVLVIGAGGGLEIKAFATAHPRWEFTAVDPSEPMIDLARATLGALASRMQVHQGYIDDAPEGPFDAATALLLLHLTDPQQRLKTLAQVHQRLRPGAPFVVMHVSYPQDGAQRQQWIDRHISYLLAAGNDRTYVDKAADMINNHMPALTPDHDRSLLEQAGFTGIEEFFTAFTFRGWIAYA